MPDTKQAALESLFSGVTEALNPFLTGGNRL